METCCIKGCENPVEAMGLCVNHYRMNQKHGSPVAERPLQAILRGKSSKERFFHSVEKSDGCWLWTAGKDKDGYGRFRGDVNGVMYYDAHRFSWAYHNNQPIPRDLQILHSCDTPGCVNPDHLTIGTAHQNSLDMVSKGRQSKGEEHARKHARLTEEQARAIAKDPRKYAVIAEEYGVRQQAVFNIKNRNTWWFLADLEIVKNKQGSKGEDRSKTLSDDDVRGIRNSIEPSRLMAAKYGVSQSTICDIRVRRSWKHVT